MAGGRRERTERWKADPSIFLIFDGEAVSCIIIMVDKASAPAFSMGISRKAPYDPSAKVPGPGSYPNNSSLNQHGPTILNDARFKYKPSNVPGPGAYEQNPNSSSQGPKALVLSRSQERAGDKVPGPGSYQPNYRNLIKSESGYTLSHSQKIGDMVGEKKKLPGPGNYQTNYSTVQLKHGTIIGKDGRSDMAKNRYVPGPGQYQAPPAEKVNFKQSSSTVFGKSGRSLSNTHFAPGPGAYAPVDALTQSVQKAKGFSLSSRHPDTNKALQGIPGPGQYDSGEVERVKLKGSSFSIGKASRLKLEGESEFMSKPGPTNYNTLPTKEGRHYVFSKDKRHSLANDNQVPGPGTYQQSLKNTLPLFSVPKAATNTFKLSDNPGPGSYAPKEVITTHGAPQMVMPKDSKRPFYDEKKGVPGPGSYEQQKVGISTTGGYSMGHQKREGDKTGSNPGPGNYNIPTAVGNIPKYSH